MLKIFIIGYLLINTSLFAENIQIAVAANVSYAIAPLTKEFNTLYPDTKVSIILGSSGKLTAQIKHGAPYQLFMSANMKYPNSLYNDKIAITKPRVYAKGSLAYFSTKKQDFTKGLKLTQSKTIKKIAVANPKTAPYGIATAEALKHAGLYEDIKNKFVYGESISQTFVYSVKATDLGFVAKSLLYSPKMTQYKQGVHWEDVDSKLYRPISQGIVILKNGKNSAEVLAFYNFIFSVKAQKILKDFGYLIP